MNDSGENKPRRIIPTSNSEFMVGSGVPAFIFGSETEKPDWRQKVDAELREALKLADSSHDILHVNRVFKLAKKIAELTGSYTESRDVLEATAKGHDLVQYSKDDARSKNETKESADRMRKILEGTNFPTKKIEQVAEAIYVSSTKNRQDFTSFEGSVISAADKLDQTGVIGFFRYCSSSGKMGRKHFVGTELINPNPEIRELNQMDNTLDALEVRMPLVERRLNQTSHSVGLIGEKRNLFFNDLKEQLRIDLNNQDIQELKEFGVEAIMNIFSDAGREGRAFYDEQDVWAEQRELQPKKFPIDNLLFLRNSLQSFLENYSGDDSIKNSKVEEILSSRLRFINKMLDKFKSELEADDVVFDPDYEYLKGVAFGDRYDKANTLAG